MKIRHYARSLLTASLMPIAALGCATGFGERHGGHTLQHDFGKEIPPGALPDPPGQHVRRFQATQVKNAEAIQYSIFLNEWYMGGTELGPYGEHHVLRMIRYLPTVPHPVLIQPAPNPAVNETRRNVIVGKLLAGGILDAEARVRIANPDAEGMFGDQAPFIYRYMLYAGLMNGRGGFGGGYGGFGGGFGGGLGGGLPGGFLPFGGGGFGGGVGGFGGFPGFGGAFGGGFGQPGVIPY